MSSPIFLEAPQGFQAHQESSTQILTPITSSNHTPEAFINPVQEYNRDLSIASIRAWNSIRNDELKARWLKSLEKQSKNKKNGNKHTIPIDSLQQEHETEEPQPQIKKIKLDSEPATISIEPSEKIPNGPSPENDHFRESITSESKAEVQSLKVSTEHTQTTLDQHPTNNTETSVNKSPDQPSDPCYFPPKFTALEALSATGLRAIRYAKEIPSMKWIIANDLSASAVKIIKANIKHNGLEPQNSDDPGKVRVNQGDACDLMYSHRAPNRQFDLVDLDPYGTAAPFMDAAVQCVRDGGLLCVTCTDLAVLAGSAYPEKCFANYGGSSLRAEYSHEYALRQVIHALSSSAARYGKQIKPVLSLSIDFYVRIFVRVYNSPMEVKKSITNTALVYVCASCSAYHLQPLGKSSLKSTKSGNSNNTSYHNSLGPPMSSSQCEECGGKFHVAGPLWSGPLHDDAFIARLLDVTNDETCGLKTVGRIKGMVEIAKRELVNAPFFFTPSKLSSFFHCTSPSLITVASALLNAGYEVSRSHCQPGSIKTNAPRSFVYDIMRKWIETNPVKMANVKEGSPSWVLLSKPMKSDVSLEWNPKVESKMMTNVKVVRYQSNPLPNWGPKSRAKAH